MFFVFLNLKILNSKYLNPYSSILNFQLLIPH